MLLLLPVAMSMGLAQETVRRLTQEEAVRAALAKPQPEYPSVARQLKIQGRIEMEIAIDANGSVEDVKVVAGNPALASSALSTLKKWRFEPFQAGGKPVRAVANLSFSFKL